MEHTRGMAVWLGNGRNRINAASVKAATYGKGDRKEPPLRVVPRTVGDRGATVTKQAGSGIWISF